MSTLITDSISPISSAVGVNFTGNYPPTFQGESLNARWPVKTLTTSAASLVPATPFVGHIITSATAVTCSLPNTWAVGSFVHIHQRGAGQVTFSAVAGGSLVSYGGQYKTQGQYANVVAYVIENSTGTNAVWTLTGDKAA